MQQYAGYNRQDGDGEPKSALITLLNEDKRPSILLRPCAIIRDFGPLHGAKADLVVTDTLYENAAFQILLRKESTVWKDQMVKQTLDTECPEEVVIVNSEVRCLVRKSGEYTAVTVLNYVGVDPAQVSVRGQVC